jgi:urease accessory protein
MLTANIRLNETVTNIDDSITLDFDTRQKARIKSQTDAGTSIGIFLERGKPLMIDEILKTECGKTVQVKGALEPAMTATTKDWLSFSQVCYHLGNRHTRLQVGDRWLRFQPDHVLLELVQEYGLSVSEDPAIFEPEKGAYSKLGKHSGTHSHSHSHGHSHAHSHEYSHKHEHD